MNPKQKVRVVRNKVTRYPGPVRFPMGPLNGHREQMSPDRMQNILAGQVAVEEKMDGRHASFSKFPFQFFVEDLCLRKRIPYRVPGRYAIFDVFDMREKVFLAPDARLALIKDLRCQPKYLPKRLREGLVFPVPTFVSGTVFSAYLPQLLITSAYAVHPVTGDSMPPEGIVIKPMRAMAPEEYVSGMLLAKEFYFNSMQPEVPAVCRVNSMDPGMKWEYTEIVDTRFSDVDF